MCSPRDASASSRRHSTDRPLSVHEADYARGLGLTCAMSLMGQAPIARRPLPFSRCLRRVSLPACWCFPWPTGAGAVERACARALALLPCGLAALTGPGTCSRSGSAAYTPATLG